MDSPSSRAKKRKRDSQVPERPSLFSPQQQKSNEITRKTRSSTVAAGSTSSRRTIASSSSKRSLNAHDSVNQHHPIATPTRHSFTSPSRPFTTGSLFKSPLSYVKQNQSSHFSKQDNSSKMVDEQGDFWMTPSKNTLKATFSFAEERIPLTSNSPSRSTHTSKSSSSQRNTLPKPQLFPLSIDTFNMKINCSENASTYIENQNNHSVNSNNHSSLIPTTPPHASIRATNDRNSPFKTPPRNNKKIDHSNNNGNLFTTPVSQRKMIPPNAPTHVRSSIMRNRVGNMFDQIQLSPKRGSSPLGDIEPVNLLDMFRSPSSKKRKRQRVAL